MSTAARLPAVASDDHADRNDTLPSQQPTERAESEDFHNPLWIVAGGMAFLFGTLAALLALG